jgi:hypothetical protein
LLCPEDIERVYRIKPKTLAQWRWKKIGPDYIKIGGMVRYRLSDLENFFEKHTRRCAS